MARKTFPPYEALYPTPVVLVSCAAAGHEAANIITIAWCGIVCSQPPLISISIRPHRHSHCLISAANDFVVNIPSEDYARAVDRCGILSGATVDKWKECSFTPLAASKVRAPLIAECPVNIECATRQVLHLGSHDMFIGEVLCVHADTSVLTPDGSIDYAKTRPLTYVQGKYWNTGTSVGSYGYSRT